MEQSTNKLLQNQIQIFEHEKNDTKSFEMTMKDDKLVNIKIYYKSGQILSETCLMDGQIISYKIFKEIEDDTINIEQENLSYYTSKLEYEICLDKDKNLSHCKFYDIRTNNLKYEGGFINDKKSGYGKKFFCNGNILYDGNWLNDLMDGFGTLYYLDGTTKYHGNYQKGKKNQYGITYFENGNICHEGMYCNGHVIGDAKVFNFNGSLRKDGKFGYRNFKGSVFSENSIKTYEGEMSYNSDTKSYVKDNKGTSYYKNGSVCYSGQWKNDNKNGYGILYYGNGIMKYSGQFKDDQLNGLGARYDYSEKLMYEGRWKDNILESMNLTEEQQLEGCRILSTEKSIHIIKKGINGPHSYFVESYFKCDGQKRCETNCQNQKENGKFKKFYSAHYNTEGLYQIGYKCDNKLHGRQYRYKENGKFCGRAYWSNNKLLRKFTVQYQKNGEIYFTKSYKNELYTINDFRRDYI